ncbi:MAG: DUF488 family protein [Burkholderiaceae bacterium]
MAIRIIRLGTPRESGEGPRIGTVRRPPRGVPKSRFAADDWYDTWFPDLAPSQETIGLLKESPDADGWRRFARRYRAEMKEPHASHSLDLLATLSQQADFSLGCYCEDESRCHRSILRELLAERGARIA